MMTQLSDDVINPETQEVLIKAGAVVHTDLLMTLGAVYGFDYYNVNTLGDNQHITRNMHPKTGGAEWFVRSGHFLKH